VLICSPRLVTPRPEQELSELTTQPHNLDVLHSRAALMPSLADCNLFRHSERNGWPPSRSRMMRSQLVLPDVQPEAREALFRVACAAGLFCLDPGVMIQ
jgi:hypothetical protein